MNVPTYILDLIQLGVVVGGFGLAGNSLCGRCLPTWGGAPAVLVRIVAAISVAMVTCEILGLTGLLTGPALLVSASVVGLTLHHFLRPTSDPAPEERTPTIGTVALVVAAAAAAVTAIHWAGPVLQSFDVGTYRQDSTWYHLPLAAWFAQTGSVGDLLLTDPLKLTVWYYPLNSELLHGAGMALLGNDLLSPLLNFGWMGIALLAAWCIGRPFGLAVATLLGTVLIVGSDMMLVQAGNAPSDIVALACLLASLAILANGLSPATGTGSRGRWHGFEPEPLAFAALAAGLAVGTKVSMLVPVGVITVGILVRGGGPARRRAAIWLGGLLATGGFWYLRNLVHAGNPLPWIQIGPLSGPDQQDLYPRPAHSIAEYLADRHAWTEYFLPGFADTLGPLWSVVLFAALAGLILGLRRRHAAPIRVLALAGLATLSAHVLTPISASGPDGAPYGFASNLRYAAPGLVIGLILLPLCESHWMSRRVIVPAYTLLAAAAAIGSAEWVQPQPAAAIALGTVAVLVPLWLARRPPAGRRNLVVGALVVLSVLAAYPRQRQYLEDSYQADLAPALDNPGFRSTRQWHLVQTWARAQHGMRIGIVGTPAAFGQYVFYGEDLTNEVRYLGEPTARGGLAPIRGCERWRELINEGRFDAVVITPEDPGDPRVPPQIGWTGLDRAAKPAVLAYPAAAFLLAGQLDPRRCGRGGKGGFEIGGPPLPRGPGPGWLPGAL